MAEKWIPELKKGRFTAYCKRHGFSGSTIECIRFALREAKRIGGERGKEIRGMAMFALRAKKGALGGVKGKAGSKIEKLLRS